VGQRKSPPRFKGKHGLGQGGCAQETIGWGLNIGRIILGTNDAANELKKQYDYIGIAITQTVHDGDYPNSVVSGVYNHGTRLALTEATVTLSKNVTQGTFTGKLLTGPFSC
jgi:hypothetical protein